MQKLAIDTSLRWLTKLAGSELADRLGLREPANRLLYQVTKVSFGALERVVRLKPGSILPNALRAERRGGPATGLFDLTPTETQAMTQKTLRRFAEKVMRPEARAADDAGRPPASALKQARELGLLPMLLPEGLGGAGEPYSPISNALIAEALSWGDMALAVALLAPLSVAQALIDWGNARQQATYLAPFADNGELAAALALVEPQPLFDPWSLRSTARRDRRGFRLRGEKTLVPLGASASYFLIAAHLEELGPRLFLVERGADGLMIEHEPTMGLRGADLARLRFDDLRLDGDALLGDADAPFDYQLLVDRSRVAWAALALGTTRAVLDYVIPYCNERIAFGEPITNRQAVAFMIADLAIESESLRMLTLRAASLLEKGRDATREASLAHLFAAEKGMQIGTNGVQLLGGHGFIKEHPVELWYRHLRAIAVVEGGVLV